MSKISRATQKIFASAAANNGQFGSGQAGTKVITNSLATIQALSAFEEGWLNATLGASRFPCLEEFQSLHYMTTTQIAYMFQEGISEYDSGTTYYEFSVVKSPGTYKLYGSVTDNNTGNALTDPTNWKFLSDLSKSGGTVWTGASSSGGTANAQTVTTTTADFTLVAGNILDFVAGHTNTGATTLNTDGTGAIAIKKQGTSGLIDLVAGDITTTQTYIVVYDGVYYELQSAFNPAAFLQVANNLSDLGSVATALLNIGVSPGSTGDFANLKGVWASNTTANYTADALTVLSSANSMKLSAFSKTLNSATSGAGGLDTGAIAASTWYAVYAISKDDGTQNVLMSLSFSAPTMPATYTHKALIGAVRTDGSNNFLGFTQSGRDWSYVVGNNLSAYPAMGSGSTSSAWSGIAVAAFMPSVASSIRVSLSTQNTGNGQFASVAPNNSFAFGPNHSPSTPLPPMFWDNGSNNQVYGGVVEIFLESSNIYYASSTSAAGLLACGFKLNL